MNPSTCLCCGQLNDCPQCSVCLQPNVNKKRRKKKPILTWLQVGTKRTRPKLYHSLIPLHLLEKAEQYLEYLEKESRFSFINRLARMSPSLRNDYLNSLFDDSDITEVEQKVF